MKRILASFVILSLAGVAVADDTATLYSQKCATCHGKDGKGTSVGLKMGAKDLTATKLSEQEVEGVISGGKGKMTAYKDKLSADQIKSLAKFVKGGLK